MRGAQRFDPALLLPQFDEFLARNGQRFEAVVIGAGALGIMRILKRSTIDFDVLDPEIPPPILELAEQFRKKMDQQGTLLLNKWLNNGPRSLLNYLPKDWKTRIQLFSQGKALTFYTLGRPELLKDKLWGFCDERPHDREAILSLRPTRQELEESALWVKDQEANPRWPHQTDKKVNILKRDLGYE